MKKIKRNLLFLCLIMLISLCTNNYVLAKPNEILVGKDNLFIDKGTKENKDKTAIYNATDKTLTLNNYNGERIKIEAPEELT